MEEDSPETSIRKRKLSEWALNLPRASFTSENRLHQTMSVEQEADNAPHKQLVPASTLCKLAYFRLYMSSSSKLEPVVMFHRDLRVFFWMYLENTFLRSFPVTYVHFFMSLYAPNYHYFISKMAPLFKGSTFIFIGTAITELFLIYRNLYMHMVYFFDGVYKRTPWNRCPGNETRMDLKYDNCYTVDEIIEVFKTAGNITFRDKFFVSEGKRFQVAQVIYFILKKKSLNNYVAVIVMLLVVAHYNQLYKQYVWMVLHRVQIVLNVFLLITFIHLVATYDKLPLFHVNTTWRLHQILMKIDVYFLSESLASPPIIHFLNTRSANRGSPTANSALMVISNLIYYLFKGLISYLLKNHCQNVLYAPLKKTCFSKFGIYYFWTLYFSRFYFGNVYALVFFGLNTVVGFYVLVITFHSLVESLAEEWRMNGLVLAGLAYVAVIVVHITIEAQATFMYITWSCASNLLEVLVVFWIYPVSRLMDDFYFFYGTPMRTMSKLLFFIVPVYCIFKVLKMLVELLLLYIHDSQTFAADLEFVDISLMCIGSCLGIGVVYAVIEVLWKKQGLCQLCKPIPEWGPAEFHIRQLRKKFDSRSYIESEELRQLNRYIIQRAESNVYKINIPYNKLS